MLAAAGETEALDVRWGVAALAAVVVGLLVFAGLSARTSIFGRVPLDKEPAVLADRADRSWRRSDTRSVPRIASTVS